MAGHRRRCVPSLMRVVVCGLLVFLAALPQAESQSLQEAWLRVQQGLTGSGSPDLDERLAELEETAAGLQARRLTPYAAALVAWAEERPGELGELVLNRAKLLGPKMPSPFFLSARWQWQDGAYFDALGSYLAGLWNMARFEESRHVAGSSAVLCAIFALGLSLALVILVQTALYLRQLSHDGVEIGLLFFGRANAIVFAIVILLLPLFAGFGPIWLVAYLYALGWAYMRTGQRIFGVVALIVLSFLPVSFEIWQTLALRQPPVTDRVARMLDERQAGFASLREFADLEQGLAGSGDYHLIFGELLRMHGELDRARVQFQKAAVSGIKRPDAHVSLGSLSMEDGDVPRAIQHYNQALEIDSRCALAFLDLSLAYDQSRRFQEGDEARNKAKEIAGRQTGALGLPGSDPRIRYPRLGTPDVKRLVSGLSSDGRRMAGISAPRPDLLGSLLSPFTVAMWVSCVIGVVAVVASSKWGWTSSACTRCGKVFCPRCKSSTESMSYCSQCISVFLKRDMVSIDQQTAKLTQVRRWEVLTSFAHKVVGLLLPGGHYVIAGRVFLGFFICLLSILFLVAALMWLPMFFPSAEPLAPTLPLQIAFLVCFALLWMQSAVATWYRR